ncbi:M12 family metallo-peptidase [Chitinophaga sp. HK235]|uniref:M12 family metallo-peptidase n=1 Tax=Chitinophaga sp. HK235 TaxID=2952571 RepID=UPI001BA43EBF|nr:M12 family metallo-peptidase [Chitinophaga sp. HK235]
MKQKIILSILLLWLGKSYAQQPCDTSFTTDTRILVAYTDKVTDPNPLKSLIQPSIDSMNLAYKNSGINHSARLVRAIQVYYNETNDLSKSLDDFREGARIGTGPFGQLKDLRRFYHADVCVLITMDGQYAGIGWGIGVNRDGAFCAMKSLLLVPRFTMAHEIGHLYGCRHELALDSSNYPFPYGHGYVFTKLKDKQGKYVHTIMAYGSVANNGVTTAPIPYFSTPKLTYMGLPLGTASREDDVRVINERYSMLKGPVLREAITIDKPDLIKSNQSAEINAYRQLNHIAGVSYTMEANSTTVFNLQVTSGTESIILRPGFHAKVGSYFKAQICK